LALLNCRLLASAVFKSSSQNQMSSKKHLSNLSSPPWQLKIPKIQKAAAQSCGAEQLMAQPQWFQAPAPWDWRCWQITDLQKAQGWKAPQDFS